MALTDIITYQGAPIIMETSRGDIGVVSDVQGGKLTELTLPSLGGATDYPSEDDVRAGVPFSTYTGNLELPDVTEVLDGVQYGSNGTELTGEAAAGGGEHSSVF